MRQFKNPEDWNPNAAYVYARPLRLGEADNPFVEVGSPVDMQDLITRVGMRRVRAFFLQGAIVPVEGSKPAADTSTAELLADLQRQVQELRAEKTAKAEKRAAKAASSRFAAASSAEPIAEE